MTCEVKKMISYLYGTVAIKKTMAVKLIFEADKLYGKLNNISATYNKSKNKTDVVHNFVFFTSFQALKFMESDGANQKYGKKNMEYGQCSIKPVLLADLIIFRIITLDTKFTVI